jgi:hypothetical protein
MKSITALFVLAFAGAASAQEQPQDPLKGLKLGDRVELMLKNGFSVQGEIISTDPKVTEVPGMKVIVLDIRWEYPELTGHVGVERIHVKSSRKLPRLEEKDIQERDKARKEALKRMEAEDSTRRARIAARDIAIEKERKAAEEKEKAEKIKGIGKDLEAKAEMLKKGAELHAKFPEAAGWGEEKIKAIRLKPITHVPLTTDESEFLSNYETWIKYKAYLEEQKTKEKVEEVVEEVKKEPAPAPAPAPKK